MYCIGIDVGSVSTDLVVLDEGNKIIHQQYLKTKGNPIQAIKDGIGELGKQFKKEDILAVGATGSGRHLAAAIVGADIVKNEITTHGVAAAMINPDVKTILEIGGQDSKIILLRDGIISDFAMNTVCAAGTGSFLDRQAERLGLKIEELGQYSLEGENPVRIAGRCAVFAESDIIHKQQLGCKMEDIIAGMSEALVRNYLSNVGKGKEILEPVFFQGGVAANVGIVAAFEKELGCKITVPQYHKVMGAFGAAILAKQYIKSENKKTDFVGFEAGKYNVTTDAFECSDCSNQCEVILLKSGENQIGAFSDRCGKYQSMNLIASVRN